MSKQQLRSDQIAPQLFNNMPILYTRLTELLYVASSASSLYANPASTKSFVKGILLHNTNTTVETVTLHWVPDSGGSVGTASNATRFATVQLAANETLFFEIPFALVMTDTNETIQGVTTTGSKVTCAIIGDQQT